jgi:hypothetical protein
VDPEEIIRSMWSHFGGIRKYNAKVQILKDGIKFKEADRFSSGRSVSFKNAMQLLGEDVPDTWKGKIDITLELGEEVKSIGKYGHPNRPTLVINGKEYKLNDKATELVDKINLYNLMWGKKYFYGGSRKVITKMRNKKKWLGYWRDICVKAGENKDVIAALEAAIAAAK